MYLLNNDNLKDRHPFWTWLFFNGELKKDCIESIDIMRDDMNKLHKVSRKANETNDIYAEFKIEELYQKFNDIYLVCVRASYDKSRLSYSHVSNIVNKLRALDKILSE